MRRKIIGALLALIATAALGHTISPYRLQTGPTGAPIIVPSVTGAVIPPPPFVPQVSALPNVLYSLDAAMPFATTAVVSGTPGFQIDTSGNVLAASLPENLVLNHGFGESLLVPDGWSPGRPTLRDTPSQVNSGYEAFNVPLTAAKRIVQTSQSSDRFFAMRMLTPNAGELFRILTGTLGVKAYGANGTDCALRIEVNLGSATGSEASGPLTVCGQRQIIEFVSDNVAGTITLLRNGTATLTTPVGQVNAWVPDSAQLFNSCHCEVAWHEQTLGLGTVIQRQAEMTRLLAIYPVDGVVTPISFGPTVAQAPIAIDLQSDFLTTVNIPKAGGNGVPYPLSTAITLPTPLTFEAGATQVFGAVFGTAVPNANITTTQQVYDTFWTTTMEGNYNLAIGSPMDTGQGNNNTFAAVLRTYPIGSVNNLHVIAADGMHLRARCSANGTDCRPGKVYAGGVILSQLAIRPGMTVKVRRKTPKGNHSWFSTWVFSINQGIPPVGTTDLFSPAAQAVRHDCGQASVTGIANCMENDLDDNFSRFGSGTPTGFQINHGSPDIYGTAWERGKFPHLSYGANADGYTTKLNAGPDYLVTPIDQTATMNDLILSWMPDGTTYLFLNNKVVIKGYLDFTKSVAYMEGGIQKYVGMQLMIQNAAIPGFSPGASTAVDNDGLGIDGWAGVIEQIGIWQGNIATPKNYFASTTNAYAGVTGDPVIPAWQTWTFGTPSDEGAPDHHISIRVNRGDGSPENSPLVLLGLSTSSTVPPSCKGGLNASATCYGATTYYNNGLGPGLANWVSYRWGPAVIPALPRGTYYFWVQTPDGADHLASTTPYVK